MTGGDRAQGAALAGAVRPTPARAGLQLLAFLIGIGLAAWCVTSALGRPGMREQLARLPDAGWPPLLAMLAISAATIALDGLMFRAVLRPVARVSIPTMLGVSGVCSALSYLPFKMSMIFRFVYHTRRDAVAVPTVAAWIGATGVVLLLSILPVLAAAVVWPQGGAWWWWLAATTMAAGGAVAHLVARGVWTRGWLAPLVAWAVRVRFLARLYDGVGMLADARAVVEGLALRAAIVALQGARFAIAAHAAGVPITPEQALLAGAAYNLVQAISPGGVAGFREAGATGALALLQGPDILAVSLAVTATEAVMNLVLGAAGAAWLRVDRLFEARPARAGAPPVAGGARADNSAPMRRLMPVAALVFLASLVALVVVARQKLAGPDPLRPDDAFVGVGMPEFTLTDQDGRPFTRADLVGRVTIVDFIFTHCPFACPRLTARMARMADELKGTPVQFLSLSVDPVHDTPAQLRRYADERAIDTARWRLVTGDAATIKAIVADALKFHLEEDPATQVPLPNGATMSNIAHPVSFVLLGPQGEVLGIYPEKDDEQIRMLVERARSAAARVEGRRGGA